MAITDCNSWVNQVVQAGHSQPSCELASQLRHPYEKMARWAATHREIAAHITLAESLGGRRLPTGIGRALMSTRLAYWRNGIPEGSWTAIVSSRLGRRLDRRPDWFQAYRGACHEIQRNDEVLVTSAKSTTARFGDCAARLLRLRSLMVHEPPAKQSLGSWLNQLLKNPVCNEQAARHEVWLSPELELPTMVARADPTLGPVRDLAVVAIADQLFVLHLRRGGNMDRLVRARLRSTRTEPNKTQHSGVFLAVGPNLVNRDLANELIELGATPWDRKLDPCDTSTELLTTRMPSGPERTSRPAMQRAQILAHEPNRDSMYLTHCTRSAFGPWPDQSEDDFIEELLTNVKLEERTPFASLSRIVRQQRLLASGRGIRGHAPVVCWSEWPLSELLRRRVFRAHRGRWDFEPYGICVQRDWLLNRGARPVIYGDEYVWRTLPAEDRAFFQLRSSRRTATRHVYDWSTEREWRLTGDLQLDQLPENAARLFVPTMEEATQLSELSRWPIVVVRGTSRSV